MKVMFLKIKDLQIAVNNNNNNIIIIIIIIIIILKLMMNIFNSINLNFLNLNELEIHSYRHWGYMQLRLGA